jgi:hypothetical protein
MKINESVAQRIKELEQEVEKLKKEKHERE